MPSPVIPQLTVYIGTGSQATYDLNPPKTNPGDLVLFVLQGRTDIVEVDFTRDGVVLSPFDVNDFTLDGSDPVKAQKLLTVVSNAEGRYQFTAKPPGTKGEEPDPPGTLSGDVDVVPPQSGGPKDPVPSGS